MVIESGVVPVEQRSLYNSKGEKNKCKNYRGISLLSLSEVGKIYSEILIDRVRRMTGSLIGDQQEGFKAERGCADKIFTLNRQVRKHERKNVEFMWVLQVWRRCMIGLILEGLWQVLGIYDGGGKLLSGIKNIYVVYL